MAAICTLLTNSGSNSSHATYDTASITPHTGKLILLSVGNNRGAAGVVEATATGCGVTWVKVNSVTSSDSKQCLTLLRALGNPTTGAITIAFSTSPDTCEWSVSEISNVDKSGTNGSAAIVQNATNKTDGTTVTGITVTLSAFSNTNNATFGCVRVNNSNTIVEGSGFTEISDGQSSGGQTLETEFKNSNDTTVDWTWGSSSNRSQAIAVEIKYASYGGSFILNMI